MTRFFSTIFFAIFLFTNSATAQQEVVWVRIEAQPTLAEAQSRLRAYSSTLPDVNGFAIPGGWYAIALGPYLREGANQVLRVYRAEGSIPRDSFIALTDSFNQQIWPVGVSLLTPTAPQDQIIDQTPQVQPAAKPEAAPAPEPTPEPQTADETPAQARASESALQRSEREALQIALKWAGFYNASIDGAFGRGTRNSMADWQSANGYETTGILTTLQRAALIDQYNAVLKGLDLTMVQDSQSGIEMKLPLGVVKFDKYEPPFAHYARSGDIDARVLLISQTGDQNTLFGLYDIMQTLEIVPQNGPRQRNADSFVLVGEAATFVSYTEAHLRNGAIKGFTLIWPAADEERRTRLLGEMRSSFTPIDGALDPAAGSNDEQRIDMVSGLEIRQPKLSRSGFYVDNTGTVVTTSTAVQGCSRITIDHETEADVLVSDDRLGIALLRPQQKIAPAGVALFQTTSPRLQSDVAVAGYSYEGALDAPTVTFGTLADLRGLQGETGLKRLALAPFPGDAGGPVFDAGGNVLGLLLPAATNGQQLPAGVSFARDGAAVQTLLQQAGLAAQTTDRLTQMAPEDLTAAATAMTVLVSCWE